MFRKSYIIQLLCIVLCAVTLVDGRALFAPYLLAAIYALYCLGQNCDSSLPGKKAMRYIVMASVLSGAFITLANYGLWLHPAMPDIRSSLFVRICKLSLILIIFLGSFCSVFNILVHTVVRQSAGFTVPGRLPETKRPYLYFVIPFVIFSGIYLTVYACCYYPGLLSLDSLDQIGQIFTGEYSNHQPFYHTMMISFFVRSALMLGAGINTAVSFYITVQVLFVAATFAFTICNMAKLEIPVWCEICACVCYALLPYHIMFSFTMWKDVYFAAFVTLLITFYVRLVKGMGKAVINYIGFGISGLFVCLIRSNGLFAYVFVLAFVFLLARRQKKILFIMAATVCVSFVLKHAVLSAMNVTPPDTVESLSIPLQQIARVITDNGTVAEEDRAFLSNIIDVDSIPEIYNPDISDPVKNAIRDFGNQQFLSENLAGFAKMYLRTFVHNPTEYVIAWVDSTCGYWNSGYEYWIWYWDVEENEYGISRSIASEGMLHAMDEYLWLFYNNRILQVFCAVGFVSWIVLLILAVNIASANRTGIITVIPVLAIMLSLVISSPVYSEFRYMYAAFTSLPIIAAASFTKVCDRKDNNGGSL